MPATTELVHICAWMCRERERERATLVAPDFAEHPLVVIVVVRGEVPDDIWETVLGVVEELLEMGLPGRCRVFCRLCQARGGGSGEH